LVPKKYFFLKIFNFVQSFVEGEVSLADGNCGYLKLPAYLQENAIKREKKNQSLMDGPTP
jgi:hypothetical protein